MQHASESRPQTSTRLLLALVAVLAIALCVAVGLLLNTRKDTATLTELTRQKMLADQKQAEEVKREQEENKRNQQEAKKLFDKAAEVLDARQRNNEQIESLSKSRMELNRATVALIDTISSSGLPDKGQRLKDPAIQNAIDRIEEMEKKLSRVSLDNFKLKLRWDSEKSSFPESIRFSNPIFLQANAVTDWRVEKQ